jgi:serine/threonine protein kinase
LATFRLRSTPLRSNIGVSLPSESKWSKAHVKTPWTPQAFGNDLLAVGAQLLQADDPVAIGGHRLAGRLRLSGSAVVYLARDASARLVAVKAAPAGEPCVRDRLRREAACARRLPPTCTARLLHDGTDQTPPFLVNDHLEGLSLEQVVDARGPLRSELVRELAIELARALAAVHRADVVHGNLLPGNVVLTRSGPRVIDFGVVQELSAGGEPAEIGAAADNPGWLAPELLTGGGVGPACDVFGWGCLVAYAATGHSPYDEAGPPCADEPIRAVVEAALAEDPADRPTADDIIARLEAPAEAVLPAATEDAATEDVADDRPAGTGRRPSRFGQRRSRSGQHPSHFGQHPSHFGQRPSRFGQRPSRLGRRLLRSGRRLSRAKVLAGVAALVMVAAALLVTVPRQFHRHPAPATALSPRHQPRPSGQRPSRQQAKRITNTAAIMAVAEPPAPARKGRSPQRERPSPTIIPMSCLTMPSRCRNDSGERPPNWWSWAFSR